MPNTFDHIAENYDSSFTHTAIGQYQRALVWEHLRQCLPSYPQKILEINCGTGEDALFLAEQGHQVIATDVSAEMVHQASLKSTHSSNPFHTETCSVQALSLIHI